MIGSMAAVAMASILTGQMQAASQMKLIAQIVSGAYIGQTVSQKDLANLPKLAKSIVSLMALFTLNMLVMGFLFHHFWTRLGDSLSKLFTWWHHGCFFDGR